MNINWDEEPDLNITPLVDIMLVLMAILMVTAPVMKYEENINMPQGSKSKVMEKIPELTISMDDKRQIIVKGKTYDIKNFANDFLNTTNGIPKGTVVYIKADKNLKYDDVMFLLKVVKDSGFSKVSLVTNG